MTTEHMEAKSPNPKNINRASELLYLYKAKRAAEGKHGHPVDQDDIMKFVKQQNAKTAN